MNPHTMTYEVLEILPSSTAKTIFTSESWDDCFESFHKILSRDGVARVDLVVRETSSGKPVSRIMVFEIETQQHSNNRGYVYSHGNDHGILGPCVYNPEYENRPWAGRECYSTVVKTFDCQ